MENNKTGYLIFGKSFSSALFAVCIAIISAGILISCQTFPKGTHITELDDEHPSIEELFMYYSMCRAAWRERDQWQDTDWELDYFSHSPTNTMALAIRKPDKLYFVFRSTQAPDNRTDLKLNLQIGLVPLFFSDDPKYKAHKGMLKKYEGIYDEVHERVNEFEGEHLTIIGHSGGGMIAAIAFFDLYHAYPEYQHKLVTFGSPRVLNRSASDALDDAEHLIYRVVMGRDFFCSIPPALFGYRHVGTLIRMGDRPFWKPVSFRDHYPRQQNELRRLYELNRSAPEHNNIQ